MKHLLAALLLAISFISSSQNCKYTFLGEVSDFHDGTPIAVATIYIKELDKYVVSDANGKFKIENLCASTITLTISHVACETKTLRFDIKGDTFKTIVLEHHIEDLSEVAVTANVNRNETTTGQETVLNQKTLSRFSSSSIGDALKEVAGVSSINTGNAIVKPMINGMHSSRLLILTNGVRLQDQEWGIEHAPNIDINSAAKVSVIKGAGTLAYGGDAIGGVIVIEPQRSITKDTLFGKTIISGQTNGRGFSVSSALNKNYASGWFVNGQGTFKKFGDYESPDYILSNTGNESKAFSVRAGKKSFESGFEVFYSYLENEIGILRSSHIGSVSDLVNAINSQEPLVVNDFTYTINSPKQEVRHHLAKASFYKRFKNFGRLDMQYDYQNNRRFEFDVRVGDDKNKPALDLELETQTITLDVVADSKIDYTLKYGILGRYQNNFANPDTGVRRLIPDYDKYDFGAYTYFEFNLNAKTTVDLGLRYDFNRIDAKKFYRTTRWEERGYDEDFGDIVIDDLGTQLLTNPVFDYHNFSASTGLKYEVNDNSFILGNLSLASRPPNPSELFSDGLHHSAARIELGDLRLTKEVSKRIGATYAYQGNIFNFMFETFYNRINNFMYQEPSAIEQTIRGAFPVWSYFQSDAAFYGFDINTDIDLTSNLNFENSSSYTIADDLDNDRPLINIPAFNTKNSLSYSRPDLNNLYFSIVSEWVFEQTRFPDNNFETFIAETDEFVLVDVSTPPAAFHLLHFYAEKSFNLSTNTTMDVSFGIQNLLNQNYRSYLNRLRYFADDLGRNISLQIQLTY